MQNTLTIVAIQANIIWEKPRENLYAMEKAFQNLTAEVDLVVLPEMFSTGFTMQPKLVAEKMTENTVSWMLEKAKTHQFSILGSLAIEENGRYYNRAVFVPPYGKIETYDKRHSFSLAGEDKVYTSGNKKLIITYKGWNIFPMICYDLRFPVWSRYHENYDVLIYMANWPKTRIVAWDSLLKARAIENMSYCIGVNRVGVDAYGYEYIGHTAGYDFLGKTLAVTHEKQEDILQCTLHKDTLYKTREKLNFLNDRDFFTITV